MSNEANLSRRAHWAGGNTIASQLMAKSLAHPELISLAAGFVDQETLPVEPTRKALEALWSDPQPARAALQYGTTIGHPPLREAVLDRMLRADGTTAAAAEPLRPAGRRHGRQQPVVAPGERYPARPGRHRDLRCADVLRVYGDSGQSGRRRPSASRPTRTV